MVTTTTTRPTTTPTASPPTTVPYDPKDPFGLGGGNSSGPSSTPINSSSDPNTNPTLYGVPSQDQGIPVDVSNLGPGFKGSTVTLAEAASELYGLSPDDLILIQRRLWDAGFFTDAAGNPMKTGPTFGVMNADTVKAFVDAMLETVRVGQAQGHSVPINDTLTARENAHYGDTQRNGTVPGITGHGYRTTVDLTSPDAIFSAVDQSFKSLLGRPATQDEKDNILNTIHSAEYAQGQAKFNAQDQMMKDYFQSRVEQRNLQYGVTGSKAEPVILSGGSNSDKAMQYFMGKGLSAFQAAGIVGNLMEESGLNPNSSQGGSTDSQISSGNFGQGIAQWTTNGRWQGVVALAAKEGKSPYDLGVQLDYLWQELQTSESGALTALQKATDVNSATEIFMNSYERPGIPNLSKRQSFANNAYRTAPSLTSTPAAGPPPPNSTGGSAGTLSSISTGTGWLDPLPGAKRGQVDQGQDFQGTPGQAVIAVASGTIGVANPDPGGFGVGYGFLKLDNAPTNAPSDTLYYGHIVINPSLVGRHVVAGQQIGTTRTTANASGNGPAGWLEIGFAKSGTGAPIASGAAGATGAGQSIAALLPNPSSPPNPTPQVTTGASGAPDIYTPGSFAVTTSAPDAQQLAYQQATTGTNRAIYGGFQSADTYQMMLQAVKGTT